MKRALQPARVAVREVLDLAWTLFQVCLPVCLPLAILAVVAGKAPGAVVLGRRLADPYSLPWWLLSLVSAALVLACYAAMLRQQLALAAGGRQPLWPGLRAAVGDVPGAFLLVVATTLPFVPAMFWTAWRSFDVVSGILTLLGACLSVYTLLAWPAMVALGVGPGQALACSLRHVRGRWGYCLGVFTGLLALTLIFILLASILLGMVMNLAGQGIEPTPVAQAFSNCVVAIVLAAPGVYAGAVVVTLWQCISGDPASRVDPAHEPVD